MSTSRDESYLAILTRCIRVCADYKPKLGHGRNGGYALQDFQKMYRKDPFYSWLGLDNALMYAAHKAAGGMTSVYRQIGIGCEVLFRQILQDALVLKQEDVKWSYTVPGYSGKARKLHLDARIPMDKVASAARRRKIQDWLVESARSMDVNSKVTASLQGVVFEIRQGYKTKDSKRQNADIANAAAAYTKGLLPCVGILSMQIDDDIAQRYRNARWVILTGKVGRSSAHESFYSFTREIVGYDLASFFRRNSKKLKQEVETVLKTLLRAK